MATLSSVITQTVGNSSGGVNLITSPSASSIWTASGLTLSTTTTTAELPLEGFSSTAVKFLLTGSTTSAYVDFTAPSSLLSTKLALQWYARANVTTIGSITLTLNSYSSSSNRTSNTSPTSTTLQTSSVASAAQSFQTTFDSHGTNQYYRLTLSFPASASNWYTIAQMVVGPGQVEQGAAISEWQSFPPTYSTGAPGTNTTVAAYRRVGSSMEIQYSMSQTVAGTNGSGSYLISIPGGYTIDTTKAPVYSRLGEVYLYNGTTELTGFVDCSATNSIRVISSAMSVWGSSYYGFNSSATLNVKIQARVPIAEWAGSGTVNLGPGAQVEYAYNSSTSTTNDTTSFAYGPTGIAFTAMAPAGTAAIIKRVRFQYPIQSDDLIILEIGDTNGMWSPVATRLSPYYLNDAGTTAYGAQIGPVSTTDVDVYFYSGWTVGQAWSTITSLKWRVRKAKASAPVGFGLAGTDGSSGLYKAGQAPGLTTGATIAAGYVGETVITTLGPTAASNSNVAYTVGTYTPTAGVWLVHATSFFTITGIVGNSYLISDINSSATLRSIGYYSQTPTTSGTIAVSGSPHPLVFNATGSNSITALAQYDYSTKGSSTVQTRLTLVRIA